MNENSKEKQRKNCEEIEEEKSLKNVKMVGE